MSAPQNAPKNGFPRPPQTPSIPHSNSSGSATQEFIEGVRIHSSPSPVGRRIVAALIDMGIVSAVISTLMVPLIFIVIFMAGLMKAMADRGETPLAPAVVMIVVGVLFLIGAMGIMHGYYIYYEFKKGATPGKKFLGLRVISVDGKRLTKGQAIYRDMVRWYLDALLIFPALIAMYSTEKRQRVGDILAGTMVIHSKSSEERETFLYVKREDYQALIAHLQPRPVEPELRARYLAFANRAYIMGQEGMLGAERAEWLPVVRRHLEKSEQLGLNDLTVLRFFAEFCFQADLQRRENQR